MSLTLAIPTMREVPQVEAVDARGKLRALFEFGALFLVCAVVIGALAGVMRAAEYVISEKILIAEAQAATVESAGLRDQYRAKLLLRTGERITMYAGEELLYRVGFKNEGTATWRSSGARYLSIYTVAPNYRESDFYHSDWRRPEQPAALKDASVPPGTIGFFEFILRAPRQVGNWRESFHLAVEDLLWLPGGGFEIEIIVEPRTGDREQSTSTSSVSSAPQNTTPPQPPSSDYSATLLLRSHKTEVALGPGATIDMIAAFKNSGTATWQSQSLRAPSVTIASVAPSFRHLSWAGQDEAARLAEPVSPGRLVFFHFTVQSPNKKGSYAPTFQLVADDIAVPGGEIQIPITVTADGPDSSVSAALPAVEIIPEPTLRVGLFKTERPVMITADGDYDILQDGAVTQTVRGGQPTKVIFDFDYKIYTVANANGTNVYRRPVRFLARDPNGIFTIPSYEHRPGWNKSLNDNMFRRSVEIYQADNTGNLWVVNELPMEEYLYGIAETSNPTEPEFQKALATAARTYAFYHWTRNSKHGGHFHIDATFDQVYRGYASEIRMPQWVDSVRATRGAIAIYGSEIAITPYYSRSDGRTRDWTEVWGGSPKPWLKSVRTNYDEGQSLWGHGVGMSARDALLRARNEGLGWPELLGYYYRGVDIVKKWP